MVAQEGVHPVGVGSSILESVVVDNPQSVSECLGVHGWVQGIFSRVEDAQSWSVSTGILLFCQVLIKLSSSKLLIALGLLVLSYLELGFQILDTRLNANEGQ